MSCEPSRATWKSWSRSGRSAWLRCSRDTLDALSEYKARNALPTWDATLTELLAQAAPDQEDETGVTQQ